jgi:hypothetical protein
VVVPAFLYNFAIIHYFIYANNLPAISFHFIIETVNEEGNISDITQIWSGTYHHTVQYHSAKVELDDDNCTILSLGTNWNVYAVGNNSLLAFANGDNNNSVEHFVKKDVPEEMLRADEIMKKPVPEYILGKWVTTHYT